jgi:tetratricopeptide (TPR) repeat protein
MADLRPPSDFLTFETGEATPNPKSMPMPWEEDEERRPSRPPPVRAAALAPEGPANLPRRRLFVGRDDELRAADEALAARAGLATLSGMAGAGKTAAALELAHRAAAKRTYPGGIWWVAADGPPAEALARLAPALRAVGPAATRATLAALPAGAAAAEAATFVRLALAAARLPALLVLDGIDAGGWAAHLPGGDVRVLATARDGRLGVGARVTLGALEREHARELARAIAGTPDDEPEAKALDRVLDSGAAGLAAAIEAAGRAVTRWAGTWVDYERFMYSDPRTLLEERDAQADYTESVQVALDRSIDGCPRATAARRLLEGAAAFAPEQVPLAWACTAAELDPTRLETRRALAELRWLGLGEVDDEARTLSMNRLIHRRVRERADPDDFREANQRAAVTVAAWLEEKVDPTRTTEVEGRRAHLEEGLAAAERGGCALEWVIIADRLGAHLRHLASYPEARSLLERAVTRAEQLDPPNPSRLTESLSALASLLKDMGQPADARPHLERALALDERTHGPEHPSVARDLLTLAGVLKDLGQSAEARPLLERALAIDEVTSGAEHPNTAKTLATLATVLKDLGHPAEARAYLERALAIDEKVFGPDHPSAVVRLTNLAMILKDMGQAAEAKPLLQRALLILEGTYGGEHPIVATSLTNLALVLRDLGQVVEAKQNLSRANRIAERTLPASHPTRQKIAAHLANTTPPPAPSSPGKRGPG